jgi:hypothetical protein
MSKKITNATRARFQMDAEMHLALILLGWNEEAYQRHMAQAGIEYLQIITNKDMASVQAISETRVFRGWWRLHWHKRLRTFLIMAEDFAWGQHQARYQYRTMNNALELAMGITFDSKVLEDSYSRDVVPHLK